MTGGETGLKLRQQIKKALPNIPHNWNVDLHTLRDRRRVDIDVHNLVGVLGKMLRISDHTVVKPGPNRNQHIAMLHRHVGLVGPVHPGHPNKLGVTRPVGAEPHQSVGARKAQQIHQPIEFRRRVGQNHATAGVNHRALSVQNHLNGLANLALMPLDDGTVGPQIHFGRIFKLATVATDILRDIHQYRSRASGIGNVKRFFDGRRKILDIFHQEIVLHAGASNPHRVAFLKSVQTDCVRGHLAGEHHHGDRIHVGGRNARHRIGDARTTRDQANADLARGPRVRVGSMNRCLFVAHQNVLDLILRVQRVVDVKDRAAGIPKDVLDPFFLEAADDNFRAG